uniref:Selenoprotein W, 2a n=1 Tax=Cyclopterus lumpus TaxID=8103 RepID=A0A8C2ZP19_CYCLU
MRVRTPLPGAPRRGQARVPRRGRVRHRGKARQVLLVTLFQLKGRGGGGGGVMITLCPDLCVTDNVFSFHFTGSFEIELNGQLIFSKIETSGFPNEDDVMEQVQNAHDGKPMQKITKSRAPCVIM